MDHIVIKALTGEASLEERAELEVWLNSNPTHFTQYVKLKSYWESRVAHLHTTSADEAYEQFKLIKLTKKYRSKKPLYISLAAFAAIALILLLIGRPFAPKPIETFTFSTKSEKDTLLLPDSSTVILNKNSKLVYSSTYSTKERHLKLEGEGFFDVRRNPEKPFVVEMINSRITVLGTAFNVRAYPNDDFVKATLVRGSIRFNRGNDQVTLKPNQELNYSKQSDEITIRNVDMESSMLWLKNVYRFQSISLQNLLNELGAIYDLKIDIANSNLARTVLSGSFQKDQSISDILSILSSSVPISWSIQNQTVTIVKKD